jgi:peptidoglycan L-alanyl-D-glutamate endopeptidase CwlK
METQSIAQLQTLHPYIRVKAIDAYNECVQATPIGVHPYITEGLRSFERSTTLYAQGRTKPGEIVTNAKAGQSWHNYGLAFDFVIQRNGKYDWTVGHDWLVCVNIFKAHGFSWGGDFKSIKDYPHFEMRFGLTTSEALRRHNAKDFIQGTNFIRI